MSTPGLAIRPATRADVDPVARLVVATPLWQRYGVTFDLACAALREGLDRGDALLVAQAEGIAGFAWVLPRGAFGRSPYLKWIGVAGGGQRRGVGRALLAAAEVAARAVRPELFLLVSDFNVEAQRLYLRAGYRQVGALEGYVLPGVTELVFWKRLR